MKNLLAIAFILFLGAFTAVAQEEQAVEKADGPEMSLESTTVDYGTIAKNSDPLRKVSFTNTGTEPLIIKHAKGSCGCTVPKWPKEPIMPGESSEIEIRYSTNRTGKINKTVRITTNEEGKTHVLRVVGKVLNETEDQSAPKKEGNMLKSGS